MSRSLITDTLVISTRKKKKKKIKNVHFKVGEASKMRERERKKERKRRVNKPSVPQPPQNSSFTEKKIPQDPT